MGSWQQAWVAGGRVLGPGCQHQGLGQSPGFQSFLAGQLENTFSGAGLRVTWGLGLGVTSQPL